jgi:hypothetical protein
MKDKSRKELHTNPGSQKYSLPARQVFKKNDNYGMYLIGYATGRRKHEKSMLDHCI